MRVGYVRGRGVRRGEAVAATRSGVTVRVDDELNPEFWLELVLSRADLEDMLSAARAAAYARDDD